MADLLKLQGPRPIARFKVRSLYDLGCDEVIEHLRSFLHMPEWAGASQHRSIREIEEQAKRDKERTEVEYDQMLAAIRLRSTPNTPTVDRAGLGWEVRKLQDRITVPIYG